MPEPRGFGPDNRQPKKPLEVGRMYAVLMHYQAGNYRWVVRDMHALFVREEEGAAIFSLRPLAGTQEIPREWIVGLRPLPDGSAPTLPRRVPRPAWLGGHGDAKR